MTLIWTLNLFDQFIIHNDHMNGVRPFHLMRAPLHLQIKFEN